MYSLYNRLFSISLCLEVASTSKTRDGILLGQRACVISVVPDEGLWPKRGTALQHNFPIQIILVKSSAYASCLSLIFAYGMLVMEAFHVTAQQWDLLEIVEKKLQVSWLPFLGL